MKRFHFTEVFFWGIISLLTFSCSNDFLYEKSSLHELTSVQSTIAVSPAWAAEDYPVTCQEAGNAAFRIVEKPDWLTVGSLTGTFTDGAASIHCSAKETKDFSQIGIYYDYMTIEDENGGKYTVQVFYVSEGNPRIETAPANIHLDAGNLSQLQIVNTGEGILVWQVAECPEWLQLSTYDNPLVLVSNGMPGGILPQGAFATLSLDINFSGNIPDKMSGQIVIESNDKANPQKTIPVNVDPGSPRIPPYLYNQTLDFGRTATSLSLELYNQGNGILLWEFTGLPEWLTCSPQHGTLTYNRQTVTFTADRNRVPEGTWSATVYLNSNDATSPKIPVAVKIRNATANPAGVVDVDGNVTAARLDKPNGKLYYTTAQPNRLVELDIVSKTVTRSLDLTKAPACFSISDDGKKIVIGQAGQFSVVDLNGFTLTGEWAVYCPVNDIAWATNDVVTYTPGGNVQFGDLYWIDIRTGIISTGTDYFSVYHGSLIKKLPGQEYLLYTDLRLFPGGISVIDIQTKNRQYYTHESIGNFWFSQNGKYLFCEELSIYRVSDLVNRNDVSPIAVFRERPVWVDDHTATNSVWSLQSAG
ncbi:MAG: hypothetical protein LBF89_06530, partial [Bacteroidales bacterium]|nr:hypothetical protein [Bacteroidales bacterium]